MAGGATPTTTSAAAAATRMPRRSSLTKPTSKRRKSSASTNGSLSSSPQSSPLSKPIVRRTLPQHSQSFSSKIELSTMVRVINVWRDTCLHTKNTRNRVRRSASLKLTQPRVAFHPPTQNIRKLGYDSDDSDCDEGDRHHDVLVEEIEFDPTDAVLALHHPEFVTTEEDDDDDNEIPWYEQDYEELPWWEYPDLDQDDEITALCKDAMRESMNHSANGSATTSSGGRHHHPYNHNLQQNNPHDEHWEQQQAARVEAIVMSFALKLKNRAAFTKRQKEQLQAALDAELVFSDVDLTEPEEEEEDSNPSVATVTTATATKPTARRKSANNNDKQNEQPGISKPLVSSTEGDATAKVPKPTPKTNAPVKKQQQQKTQDDNMLEKEEQFQHLKQQQFLHLQQDQQERMQQLLSPTSTTSSPTKTTLSAVKKITKEDVAKMATLDLSRPSPQQKQQQQLPQQPSRRFGSGGASVLDDDSVSLHSAVLSTGWNRLNIHNSEMRRYQKNHRRRKGGAGAGNRGLWADDHTVMVGGTTTTMGGGGARVGAGGSVEGNDQDDVKSVASFQSSPAMMEYTKTKQSWFNHKKKNKEPKVLHRLTTSATFVPDDDAAVLPAAPVGKRKKKKKKKKKKGHLALFMAKEELRSDHNESAIFDIMEEIPESSNHGESIQLGGPPSNHSKSHSQHNSRSNLSGGLFPTNEEAERDLNDSTDHFMQDSFQMDSDSHLPPEDGSSSNVLQESQGSFNMVGSDSNFQTDGGGSSSNVLQESQGSLHVAYDSSVQPVDGSSSNVLLDCEGSLNGSNDEGDSSNHALVDCQGGLNVVDDSSSSLDVEQNDTKSGKITHQHQHTKNDSTKQQQESKAVQANGSASTVSTTELWNCGSQSPDSGVRSKTAVPARNKSKSPIPVPEAKMGASLSSLGDLKKPVAKNGKSLSLPAVAARNKSKSPVPSVENDASLSSLGDAKKPVAKKGKLQSPTSAVGQPRMSAASVNKCNNSAPAMTLGESFSSLGKGSKHRQSPSKSGTDSSQMTNESPTSTQPTRKAPMKEPMRKRAARRASGSGGALGLGFGSVHLPDSGPRKSPKPDDGSTAASRSKTREVKTKKYKPLMQRRASFSELQFSKSMDQIGAGNDDQQSKNGNRPAPEDPKFRMVMLRHAAMCSVSQLGGVCPSDPKCSQMKELLRHMTFCKHQSTTVPCSFPSCHESKAFLLVMHKASQILAQQKEFEKNLPPVVTISTPARKKKEAYDSSDDSDAPEFGDDDDDISDIASFASAGELADNSIHNDDKEKKTTLDLSARSEHPRNSQAVPKSARERMQRRPTWNGSVELKAQRTLGDKALAEKIKNEEEERKKAQEDLRKRHEEVKARIQARIQKAKQEKEAEEQKQEEMLEQKREREQQLMTERLKLQQIRSSQQQAVDAEARQKKLKQELGDAKDRAAASSAALQRDQEKLKAEEELRHKQEELKARRENYKEETKTTKPLSFKKKAVRRKSLPANAGRMPPMNPVRQPTAATTEFMNTVNATRTLVKAIEDKRKARKEKEFEAEKRRKEQAAAIYKAREEKMEQRIREDAAREAAEAEEFAKKAGNLNQGSSFVDLMSDKLYSGGAMDVKSEVERIKAAKLAKKLKKEKKRASMVATK